MVIKAKEQLQKANARLIGVVLNQVKREDDDYYYYYSNETKEKATFKL